MPQDVGAAVVGSLAEELRAVQFALLVQASSQAQGDRMIIKWRVVIPVEVTVYCGECGGQMIQTGRSYTVMPPLYEHRCELCGRSETADRPYPLVQYHGMDDPQLPQAFDLPPVINGLL